MCVNKRSIFFILGGLCLSVAAHAQVHDATADFVPNVSNPNGVWTYGYTSALGGTFNTFNEYVQDPNTFGWRTNIALGTPAFYKVTGSPISGVQPGQAALHGGPNGEFALVRFTVPSAGTYNVFGEYFTGDSSNTDAYLLLNSDAQNPLFSTQSTTGGGTFTESGLSLSAGDTLDYVVGNGGDGFTFDSTPINFRIAPVPAPSALAGFVVGAVPGAVLVLRRRRKK